MRATHARSPRCTMPAARTTPRWCANCSRPARTSTRWTARTSARCTYRVSRSHRAASAGHDKIVRLLLAPPPRADGSAHPKTRVKYVARLMQPRGPPGQHAAAPRGRLGARADGRAAHRCRRRGPPACERRRPDGRADGRRRRLRAEARARLSRRLVRRGGVRTTSRTSMGIST